MRQSHFLSLYIFLTCIHPALSREAPVPARAHQETDSSVAFKESGPPRALLHYLATWTGESGGGTPMERPNAVSADPAGNVYVADTGNQRVLRFDPSGRITAEIGGFGWGTDQFDGPVSVSAQNGLDVYVADMNNQRVVRCDRNLHFISELKPADSWPDRFRFGFPLDAALGMQSELYCLDGENRRVLKLDAQGDPQIDFGGFDSGEGRLDRPTRFFVGRNNRMFVSDGGAGDVKVFDMHGNFLFLFGSGVLEEPAGLCEPEADWLLAADSALRQVAAFRAFRHFDGPVTDGPPFAEPADLTPWKNRVFVLDRRRACLDLFEWTFPN
jgi:tripartite motif-containing protein 71